MEFIRRRTTSRAAVSPPNLDLVGEGEEKVESVQPDTDSHNEG